MASTEFEPSPSESPICEIGSLATAPGSSWIIVSLKLLYLMHFSLPSVEQYLS